MFSEALVGVRDASCRTSDLYTDLLEEGEIQQCRKETLLVFVTQTTKDQARMLLSVPSLSPQMLAFDFE